MKILIVEDEFILSAALSELLENEGYDVVCEADNGKDALDFYIENEVDLVLCDININGDWDGIETVEKILAHKSVPIIYLTALSDKETIERAKKTFPAAYIPKPFHLDNLRMAIEMAINNFAVKIQPLKIIANEKTGNASKETILQVNDDILIKQNYQFVKFPLNDILYLEAEKIYTNIITKQKKYVIRQSMGTILERLPSKNLVRIHRSYAVNISQIDSFNEQDVIVNGIEIPFGRSFKEDFLKHFMFM